MTDEDVERIALRSAQLVWAQLVSTPAGVKQYGWVVGQNYTATLRAMKAAEEAAANTRP